MRYNKWVPVLAVLVIAAMVTGACRVEDVIPRSTYNVPVYVEQGGEKLVVETGGEIEMQAGSTLDIQDGATVEIEGEMVIGGALDVGGDITLENDETISNASNGVITFTATTIVNAGNLVSTGTLDVQGGAITLESDDTIDNPSSGDITIAATTITLDGGADVTGALDVQGGDITLENDNTIGNGVAGTILMTADSVDISAGLDVDGLADLDTVDIDDLVNITRVTGTTGQYEDLIQASWTNNAADAGFGSNGIYMQTDPIYDVENVYGIRSRLDLRGAADHVAVNQLHGMDALINLNETKIYTVTDNISVYGAAVHGGTSGDIVAAGAEAGTLNLFYGVWGDTATVNHDAATHGLIIVSHAATYLDYGVKIESSSAMQAGLFLENHASNSPATMANGIEMSSAASAMVNGIDMEDADFTGADIVLDEGETISNSAAGTIAMGGIVDVSGNLLFGADNLSAVGYASGNTAIVAGVTAEFTATTTVSSGLTTVIAAVCVPYADPASTAATCSADWSGATVTLHSWKSADAAAGDTGTTVNYIIFGTK